VYEELLGYISMAARKRARPLMLYTSYSWRDRRSYPIPMEGPWVDYDATVSHGSPPHVRAGETIGVPGAVPGGLVNAEYLHSPAAAFAAAMAAAAASHGHGMPDLSKSVFQDCGMLVAESNITPPEYWGASPTRMFTQTIKFRLTSDQANKLAPRVADPENGRAGAYLFVGHFPPSSAGHFSTSRPIPVQNPHNIMVKVNGHHCLPQGGVAPGYPVDMMSVLSPAPDLENKVNVSYMSATPLVVAVVIARRHTPHSLVALIQDSNRASPDSVRQKLFGAAGGSDDDVISEGALVNLKCPLGQCRIRAPVRAANCHHPQCFDCETFLQLYHNRPTWKCPVCSAAIASWRELIADGYFEDILKGTTASDHQIYIEPNGDWRRKDAVDGPLGSPAGKRRSLGVETVETTDGVDISDSSNSPSAAQSKRRRTDFVDLTLDSDSDGAEDPFDFPPVTQDDIDMIAAIEAGLSSDAGSQPASQNAPEPGPGANARVPASRGLPAVATPPPRGRTGADPMAAPATGPTARHRDTTGVDAARRRTLGAGVRADVGSPTATRAIRPRPPHHQARKTTAPRRPRPRAVDTTTAQGPGGLPQPSTPLRPPIVGMSPSYTSFFLNGQLDGAQQYTDGASGPGGARPWM
ncbi:E3 SUMO-protein ligase pli1, partial [Coemansia nantahalensis]